MLFFVILCIVTFIIFASTQIIRYPSLRVFWMFMKLPVPMSFPILGPIYELMFLKTRDIEGFCEKNYVCGYKQRISTTWLLGIPLVLIHHPDDLKEVLGNSQFTDKGVEYEVLKSWLGGGLLTSSGKKWQERRKMLTTTFHFKILEDNVSNFWTHAKTLADSLLSTGGEVTPVNPFLFKCALDIICQTAMNVKLDPEDKASMEYVQAVRRVSEGLIYRMMNYYLNREWLWNLTPAGREYSKNLETVHSFTRKVIAQRREDLKREMTSVGAYGTKSAKKVTPFLDRLIEMDANHPGSLSDQDLQEEVDTFMFVGHDSTSGTVGFILWELGRHFEIQEKAYNEVYDIFGVSDREVMTEDLSKMNYLEKVIKEGMRLYPAAPYTSRRLNQDLVLGDSTKLASGFNVVISPFFVHRNPKLFPDPMKFDPERYTPEECAKRHPYAYIPFSAGPRSCLGQKFAMMQMKVLLSTVLRSCRIQSVTKKEDLILLPLVILTTEEHILIKVHPRKLRGSPEG